MKKRYNIRNCNGSDRDFTAKANTPVEAMVTMMDKHFVSFYGPMYIDNVWEIYSVDGIVKRFTVSEV